MMKAKAFLLDLDGVLTDTAQYHYLAWKQLSNGLGLKFDKTDNHRLLGVSRLRSLEIILELNGCTSQYDEKNRAALAEEKNRYYLDLIKNISPRDLLPGIEEFISESKDEGIKLAVASASKNADFVLERLGIANLFDYVADASKILNPKPHPEIFLDCSNALGTHPRYCIGVEDAQSGIEAIHAAGMFSVGIGVVVTSLSPDLALNRTDELSFKKLSDTYSIWLQQKAANTI